MFTDNPDTVDVSKRGVTAKEMSDTSGALFRMWRSTRCLSLSIKL